jgi:predicted small metal-binding protein
MPESLHYMFCCRDPIKPCGYEVKAKTREEAMELARAHARDVHGMEVTPEMEEKMGKEIKQTSSQE